MASVAGGHFDRTPCRRLYVIRMTSNYTHAAQ